MKIIDINQKKSFVKLVPDTPDDLWHLYNVIHQGDEVYSRTTREIKPNEKYSRPKRGERVSVFLGVKVTEIYWDRLLGRLRAHGTIIEGPETVPLGSHHTINISLNKPVTIVKKEKWPKHHIDRLKRASRTSERPIAIISIDDEGYAIATVKQYGIKVIVEDKVKLPGKLEAEKRSKAMKSYLQKALNNLHDVWEPNQTPIVVIGVGFMKNGFAKLLRSEAKDMAGSVMDLKSVNNGGVAGIHEAIRSGILSKAMKNVRVIEETEVIEEILKRLGRSESNVTYGLEAVKRAAESGAIGKMVLADEVLRKAPDEKRLHLEEVMRTVDRKGGEIMIISTEHEAGQELLALGGVAALLRFAIHQ